MCCNAMILMAVRLPDPQAPKLSQKNRILDNGSYHEWHTRQFRATLSSLFARQQQVPYRLRFRKKS
jgi:hypothetical protein